MRTAKFKNLPVYRICPRCQGTGRFDRGTCFRCQGVALERSAMRSNPIVVISGVQLHDGQERDGVAVTGKDGATALRAAKIAQRCAKSPRFVEDSMKARIIFT